MREVLDAALVRHRHRHRAGVQDIYGLLEERVRAARPGAEVIGCDGGHDRHPLLIGVE